MHLLKINSIYYLKKEMIKRIIQSSLQKIVISELYEKTGA